MLEVIKLHVDSPMDLQFILHSRYMLNIFTSRIEITYSITTFQQFLNIRHIQKFKL